MFCKFIETPPFLPDQNRSGEAEFLYVKEAIRACNTQGYIFYGLTAGIISQMMYDALSNPGYTKCFVDSATNITITKHIRALPFNSKLPFETIDSPYYEIACIYGSLSGAIFGYSVGAMDAIICGIMCHIRAQLLILQECLKTFIPRGIYQMRENVKLTNNDQKLLQSITNNLNETIEIPNTLQKYVHIAVCNIITHHQKIIKLAQDAEELFSPLMLVQFLFSLGILCFQLFQLSITDIESVHFFGMSSYLILMLFQIYLFCYRGNEIMLHSHNITDAVFESLWFLTDLKTQKLLLIMMIRACRPIKMTAGKFVFLSLEAFVSIVRGSGSYFMVLKNTNAPATEL
ncbi:odorant receptor [Holotrichia oblita]|nr:odorant receptor [Holotrichia oblita]